MSNLESKRDQDEEGDVNIAHCLLMIDALIMCIDGLRGGSMVGNCGRGAGALGQESYPRFL